MTYNEEPEQIFSKKGNSNEENQEVAKPATRKYEIVWSNIIICFIAHSMALYGLFVAFTSAKIQTLYWGIIIGFFLYQIGGFGITAGAHRLWCHRAYKANVPLRLILAFCNTIAFQRSIMNWSKTHRIHHKGSDTDADPHNSGRGFFFSHIGWLLCEEHEKVKENANQVDLSDLWADPIVKYQLEFYGCLTSVFAIFLPSVLPVYFWNESLTNAFFVNVLRFMITLHSTFFINSAAHLLGNRPYDRFIKPTENIWVSAAAWGEGWHNYHHAFPWDYKAAELGNNYFNTSTFLINFFAKIGWAYDLKTVSPAIMQERILKSGDNSHHVWKNSSKNLL